MKLKGFSSTCLTGEGELEEQVNKFLESGIRVASPPQVFKMPDANWHAAIFYEQPFSLGINDDDRAQRSLTAEDVQKSERITEEYCRRADEYKPLGFQTRRPGKRT